MDEALSQGIELYGSGKYQLAVEKLLNSDEDPAKNPAVSYYLGLSYTKLEKYDDALLYLEQVVTSSDNILHIYQCRMVLGFIYTITERYELAKFEFNELIKGGYESPQSYAALGYIAFVQKKPRRSVEFFEKALDLDPENVNAQNSLGYTLADLELELSRAETLCKRAVKSQPKNPAYFDSLGWVMFRQGKYEEAKSLLRKALDLAGNNKTIAGHLRAVIDAEKKI
jgi:tetratricopeptide (TPR) repeat protein